MSNQKEIKLTEREKVFLDLFKTRNVVSISNDIYVITKKGKTYKYNTLDISWTLKKKGLIENVYQDNELFWKVKI